MNLTDLTNHLQSSGEDLLNRHNPIEFSGKVVINNLIAMPVITSNSFDRSAIIDVKYPQGRIIGTLRFLKGFSIADYNGLSDANKICFYSDHEDNQIITPEYTFNHDYFLIEKKYYKTYVKEHMAKSTLWGSFIHSENIPSLSFSETFNVSAIQIDNKLTSVEGPYADNIYLSIIETNPFNRFLKLYHMIELQFDLHTAEKIRTLLDEGNKEKEISIHLRDYAKDEIKRLESIIKERCTEIDNLEVLINRVSQFKDNALTIFYEYGKNTNPMLKKSDFNYFAFGTGRFNETDIKSRGHGYPSLILKLTAYWIYRVRCCIAHNKLGEYIMSSNDEQFVVKFAEPLMKEVVKQCFRK